MPDLGWLGEVGKVLGGGVAGWAGHLFTERGRRRKMKRQLYRELMYNAKAIVFWLGQSSMARSSNKASPSFPTLHFDYYAHAKEQRDTFYEIPEAHGIDEAYSRFKRLSNDVTVKNAEETVHEFYFSLLNDELRFGSLLDALGKSEYRAVVESIRFRLRREPELLGLYQNEVRAAEALLAQSRPLRALSRP